MIKLITIFTLALQIFVLAEDVTTEKKNEVEVSEHEKLALEWLDITHGPMGILMKVEDEGSVMLATVELGELGNKFKVVAGKLAKLDPPSAELKSMINQKMEELDKAHALENKVKFMTKLKSMKPEHRTAMKLPMQMFYMNLSKFGVEMKRHFAPTPPVTEEKSKP